MMNEPRNEPSEGQQDREFHTPDAQGPAGEAIKLASQARQGVSSGRVMTILLAGLILVIVGFAVSYIGAV